MNQSHESGIILLENLAHVSGLAAGNTASRRLEPRSDVEVVPAVVEVGAAGPDWGRGGQGRVQRRQRQEEEEEEARNHLGLERR